MITSLTFKPGTLVNYRNRDWMVLPSDDEEILSIRPLGGSEEETTGVFLPLESGSSKIKLTDFPEPKSHEIGSFESAKLLFDASRLSFRNAAGPFRCMGKLSFRPRSYQLVPLVMALKLEVVRLLIADDVGIGKTIEALIILKELMERGEIKRFAVICPPHLCEQWQLEIKGKLDIDAEIIRSSTAAQLDRKIPDDQSVFHHIPYQVISIDYIKADRRRGVFIHDSPDFIIVDEAHTCALPEGSKSKSQQQRYNLLHDLAQQSNKHLLLLTATPHSGKDDEFRSLLGLLKKEFNQVDFSNISQRERKKIAKHFIQRKRENITRWLNEETLFPKREAKEVGYSLSFDHQIFYRKLVDFARGISSDESDDIKIRLFRSWAAIALIKGAMSSPAMAIEMLDKRSERLNLADDLNQPSLEHTLFEEYEFEGDFSRQDLMDSVSYKQSEISELKKLRELALLLHDSADDLKTRAAVKIIKEWILEGLEPIIFCHYISTANYVADRLRRELPKNVYVEAITSELADEQRKERIEAMGKKERRVLVATDCLSEGINLQDYFTAVLHYDLPWNPNRIEQREGRVDRYGQASPVVKTYILYGEDNPMDTFVLEVLIKKVNEIKKSTGVSIPIGEGSKSIMTEAAKRILFQEDPSFQHELFKDTKETVTNELELARRKGENLRSIFAHEGIDPELIKQDLLEVDEAIGDVKTVENFVSGAVDVLGGSCRHDGINGYLLQPDNLPQHIKRIFNNRSLVQISFESPTPKGYIYIGRNHILVEQLSQFLITIAFESNQEYGKLGRVCEIQSNNVSIKTTLVMFRVRNVIKEVNSKRESVAEEMYLWGYCSGNGHMKTLEFLEAKKLLMEAVPLSNLTIERQTADISEELLRFKQMKSHFMELAEQRAEKLVEAHGRFKELIGGRRYEKATPVLPPDVMGIYVLIPKPLSL